MRKQVKLVMPNDGKNWLHRNTTPEIYQAYKEFIATGEYPYIARVVDWIIANYGVSESDKEQLSHEVYVASSMFSLEQMINKETELRNKGFTPITEVELVEGQKIILQGVETPLKVSSPDSNGNIFGFKPRHTRTGYNLTWKKYEHKAYETAKIEGRLGMRGEKVQMVKLV